MRAECVSILVSLFLAKQSCLASGGGIQLSARFDAFRVANAEPPYDTARMKVLYPTTSVSSFESEVVQNAAPYPVVLFLGGYFVEANRYQWLAEWLVREAGVVFVLCDILGSFQGIPVLLSDMINPDNSTASNVIPPVLDALKRLNDDGVLSDALDLDRIVLGAHSAGGRVALLNANQDLVPGVVGAFVYGAHVASRSSEKDPPTMVLPLPGDAPLLLMGGSLDGVIGVASLEGTATWESSFEPIRLTYDEALVPGRAGYFVELLGFNHFAMVDPVDTTVGSSFRDNDATVGKAEMQAALGQLVTLFVRATAHKDAESEANLEYLLTHPPTWIRDADFKSSFVLSE